jgi:guanine deaminase
MHICVYGGCGGGGGLWCCLVGQQFVSKVDAAIAVSEGASFDASASLLNKPTTPRVMPSVTPRFVPTCTDGMMRQLARLSIKYGLPVQSHLSESQGEVAWVQSLHPEASSYADVYLRQGLFHFGAVMAHCVHPSSEEMALLRTTQTGAIHCASSNFLLGSGIMDVRRFLEAGYGRSKLTPPQLLPPICSYLCSSM